MIIDIERKIITIKMRRFFIALIALLLVVFSITTSYLTLWEDGNYHIIIGASSLYFIFYMWEYLLNLHYFFYSDEEPHLIFRYYTTRFLQRTNKAVQIPKSSFVKYEIENEDSKTAKLYVYQQLEKQVYKYPALHIGLLTKEQKNDLKRSLSRFSRKKK